MNNIAFTREEARGALRNGTRVEKTEFAPTDGHQIGAKAIILGSLGPIEFEGNPQLYGYFVEWDDRPGIPCFITSTRIRQVKTET